jgi:hypothetical protein
VRRKAGGLYAADLVLQLPAREVGSVAFTLHFIGSSEHLVASLRAGMEGSYKGTLGLMHRYKSTKRRFNPGFSWHRYPAALLGRAGEVIE